MLWPAKAAPLCAWLPASAPTAFSTLAAELAAMIAAGNDAATLAAYDTPLNLRCDRAGVWHFPAASEFPWCGPKPTTKTLRPMSARDLVALGPDHVVCGCLSNPRRHSPGLLELACAGPTWVHQIGQRARRVRIEARLAAYALDTEVT